MESFSGDKYRLLESIFSWEDEITFLASQSGYDPAIGLQHRLAKQKLAYEWIRELRAEFDEVYRQGLILLVNMDRERPDLQCALWRLKFTFIQRVVLLKLRLLWRAPAVDEVRRLSTALEHMIGYGWIIQDESQIRVSLR